MTYRRIVTTKTLKSTMGIVPEDTWWVCRHVPSVPIGCFQDWRIFFASSVLCLFELTLHRAAVPFEEQVDGRIDVINHAAAKALERPWRGRGRMVRKNKYWLWLTCARAHADLSPPSRHACISVHAPIPRSPLTKPRTSTRCRVDSFWML